MSPRFAANLIRFVALRLADPSFHRLADVPPELEWSANIVNAHTRRAYRNDVGGFMAFFGMKDHAQFRTVTRAHLLAWRGDLVRARTHDYLEAAGALLGPMKNPRGDPRSAPGRDVPIVP